MKLNLLNRSKILKKTKINLIYLKYKKIMIIKYVIYHIANQYKIILRPISGCSYFPSLFYPKKEKVKSYYL